MWCSSNHLRTPMCARPKAPPPSSATPILGRGRVGEEFCCPRKGHGSRSNRKLKTMRRMQASSVIRQKLLNSPVNYEFGAGWRFQQAGKEVSGTFVFLQDIAAVDNQDLAGDVGSFRRGEKANRGGAFCGRAGAAERRMQRGDFFGFRRW